MIVLASVVAIGASMNAWLNRQLLDTDNWVDASDQVLEEPAVRAALSTYLVNELASQHVKVALAGEGGDELFGGYNTYTADRLAPRLGPLAATLRPLIDLLPSSSGARRLDDKAKRFAAKEALAKALGAPVGMVWTDCTVHRTEGGAPVLEYVGTVADRIAALGISSIHLSLSHDASLLNAPTGFTVTVRDLRPYTGAGWIVALCGDMQTMPGLGKPPAAFSIDVDEQGNIVGLF